MILISNSQRDEIVRYLVAFAATAGDGGTRDYNARRLARKLARALDGKRPVPSGELPGTLKRRRKSL